MLLDQERCYRAVTSRDARFDGHFITAVRTTGIYCRPSCPATTPKRTNVEFLATAGAAQQRGYRACRRCLPDAVPGSPEWNIRADLAARAMRLIVDGVVEREGVPGLSTRLGYSERQLNRVLTAELGAGPLALARAHRAHTARLLIETTPLGLADAAFAAGLASVRQFNDTVRAVYGVAPTTLRTEAGRRRGAMPAVAGTIVLRLPLRPPFDAAGLLTYFATHAVEGVEAVDGSGYTRTLRLPHGPATVGLQLPDNADSGRGPHGANPGPAHAGRGARVGAPSAGGAGAHNPAHVTATLRLADPRDLGPAVARMRRLLDLDADPVAIDELLGADPALAEAVAAVPGIRLPGTIDGAETAIRTLLGQQVSVAAARTTTSRLAAALGERLPPALAADEANLLFPSAAAIAEHGVDVLTGPAKRTATVLALASAIADGSLVLDPGRDAADLRAELVALPGVGPWTAGYLAMRVLGDPDELLAEDLAVRRGAAALGLPSDIPGLTAHAAAWRPWRSYAATHLWRNA
ncbi:MAG: DNA-3-methyladenine glycosylase 2 family protein [Pseudonocardiales bacterium]|nr:DNA-3-methyladenine glycosylase 2 family protein [Pseudonocardiales bacterium]